MANYNKTTVAGTSRRRAKQIIINNPAVPEGVDPETLMFSPQITFVVEDRIVMADGSHTFMPAGDMVLPLNGYALAKKYPSYDLEEGTVDETTTRYGAEIMEMIVDALEDVFVTIGMERDAPEPPIEDTPPDEPPIEDTPDEPPIEDTPDEGE